MKRPSYLQSLTPAALYARVSSDRQDVDLSVAAQLRALSGTTPRRTATMSPASTWTRPRAAASPTGLSSGRCWTRPLSPRPRSRKSSYERHNSHGKLHYSWAVNLNASM